MSENNHTTSPTQDFIISLNKREIKDILKVLRKEQSELEKLEAAYLRQKSLSKLRLKNDRPERIRSLLALRNKLYDTLYG